MHCLNEKTLIQAKNAGLLNKLAYEHFHFKVVLIKQRPSSFNTRPNNE